MKVTCSQEALARGLGIVGRAVATRSPLPITANVLIATEGDRLKLTATNLEITMSCWVPARIEEEGAITVPARLLGDFVNTLPNQDVAMTVSPRSRQMRLVCGTNQASLSGLDADDFPPTPVIKDGIAVKLDPKRLGEAITHTVFAAATDDSRPVLTGVDARFEESTLTLAASDGFRLSVYRLPLSERLGDAAEIVIPARTLRELRRLLAPSRQVKIVDVPTGEEVGTAEIDSQADRSARIVGSSGKEVGSAELRPAATPQDEPVLLETNAARTQARFRLRDMELITQLVQGTFPNFSQLIPATCTGRANVQVSDFLREIRIANVFARDGSGIVRLVVNPGEGTTPGRVVVSARAEEVGDNQGEIDAAVEGEGVKIAFNVRYLQDLLQALSEGESEVRDIAMETTGPSAQGVFKPVGSDNYVHVIMPMFVQW